MVGTNTFYLRGAGSKHAESGCGFADKHSVMKMSECDCRKFCDCYLCPDPPSYVASLGWLRPPVCPPGKMSGAATREEEKGRVGQTLCSGVQ